MTFEKYALLWQILVLLQRDPFSKMVPSCYCWKRHNRSRPSVANNPLQSADCIQLLHGDIDHVLNFTAWNNTHVRLRNFVTWWSVPDGIISFQKMVPFQNIITDILYACRRACLPMAGSGCLADKNRQEK